MIRYYRCTMSRWANVYAVREAQALESGETVEETLEIFGDRIVLSHVRRSPSDLRWRKKVAYRNVPNALREAVKAAGWAETRKRRRKK